MQRGEQVLHFYRRAALGLNKAIVRPGPEGVQKGRREEVGPLGSPC